MGGKGLYELELDKGFVGDVIFWGGKDSRTDGKSSEGRVS